MYSLFILSAVYSVNKIVFIEGDVSWTVANLHWTEACVI